MIVGGVIHFSLTSQDAEATRLGAGRAQSDFAAIRDKALLKADGAPEVIVFDFAGIEHTNTSYVRNGPFWFFACGRLHASMDEVATNSADPWHVRPLPIIPMVTNLRPEVREAIDEVFYVRGAPCLEVDSFDKAGIRQARLLGALEPKLFLSLKQFCRFGREATAAGLHAKFSADGDIGVTAWNNRLAELHELLLVVRRKEGKFWHYQTVTEDIQDGRGPRT